MGVPQQMNLGWSLVWGLVWSLLTLEVWGSSLKLVLGRLDCGPCLLTVKRCSTVTPACQPSHFCPFQSRRNLVVL